MSRAQEVFCRRVIDLEQLQPVRVSRLSREIITPLDGWRQYLIIRTLTPYIGLELFEGNRRLQQTFSQLKMVAKGDHEIFLLIVWCYRLWSKEVQVHKLIALREITESESLGVPVAQDQVELREVTL